MSKETIFDIPSPADKEPRTSPHLWYPTKPLLYEAQEAVSDGIVKFDGDNIVYRPQVKEAEFLGAKEIIISPERQFGLVEATMYGLNEALIRAEQGDELRDEFEEEVRKYDEMVASNKASSYGVWAYYPKSSEIVQYAPRSMHRIATIVSNSRLILDQDKSMNLAEVRNIFKNKVPAIVGLSVGSNIGHGITMALRPDSMIVGDPALYKLTNINRVVGLRYRDVVMSSADRSSQFSLFGLRNKAEVFAEQIHEIDPFINIYCYHEINSGNVNSFLAGDGAQPAANIVIEVCDTPDVKLSIAEEARRLGVRLIRFTDAGSTVRVDVRPFDLDHTIPLAIGTKDSKLYDLMREAEHSKENFFKFAGALIGPDHLERGDEFGLLVTGRLPRVFSSVPQLGSTAMVAGGWAGEIVARMALGHHFPERFILDLQKLTIETTGKLV